jgi:alpha-galactosidase
VEFREGEQGPELSNGILRVSVHNNRGTLTFQHLPSGHRFLSDAACAVTLAGRPKRLTTLGAGIACDGTKPVAGLRGAGLSMLLRRESDEGEPEVLLSVTLYEDEPFAVLQAEIANKQKAPLRVAAFHPLEGGRLHLGGPAPGWRFYKHGWQSWSPSLVLPCSGEDIAMRPPVLGPDTQPLSRPGRFVSDLMTAVVCPETGRGVLAGFISAAGQLSRAWLDSEDASLTCASYADGVTVSAGGEMASERLYVEYTDDPWGAMERYAECLGKEMGAVAPAAVASGWCSWYQYFTAVTEADVVANLDYLAAHRDKLPVEYVQIDDGYQAGIGDWLEPNEKFPGGMQWLAERIHKAGFKAGLWLAPFLIGEHSRLWREHPEWAVQFSEGHPYVANINWNQRCYALDLTRPDVIEWVQHVFRTVTAGWGYDYVKIDFVYAGAVEGLRYDPEVTRAQAYRRGLEAVRDAAGNRFVLGCGNLIGPSVGLVDGARIGPDVAPFWEPKPSPLDPVRTPLSAPSALNSIRNAVNRSWMHGKLWANDPDCLLVRDFETEMTEEEVRSLASVIALSGGMVLDSDDLTRLSDERREIISMLLPAYGKAARPLDIFEAEIPEMLELDCGGHRVLGVFNWSGASRKRALSPDSGVHVFDAWGSRYLGRASKAASIELPPHGCRVLRLTPAADRPQVVGTSFHLLQGAVEIEDEGWDGETLRISMTPAAQKEGALFVHAPPGFGAPDGGRPAGDSVWAVDVRPDAPQVVEVRFPGR